MARTSTRMVVGAALLLLSAAFVQGSGSHGSVPVPPDHEIEVLDPNVDPLGRPVIKLREKMDGSGRIEVDIPPTVIVHRYYYTGDRKFQAGFLPGGPMIVVASHPKTGEREYIQVNMVPGAPKVTYTHETIDYDFGEQGITIHFCHFRDKAKVTYRHGRTMATRMEKVTTKVKETSKNLAVRTGLAEASKKAVKGAKNVTVTLIDRTSDVAKMIVTPIAQAAKFVPGINMLTSPPEDRAARLRDAGVSQAKGFTAGQEPTIEANR